jgi:hypothetical protein
MIEKETKNPYNVYGSGRYSTQPRKASEDTAHRDVFRDTVDHYEQMASPAPNDYYTPSKQLERMEQAKPITETDHYRKFVSQLGDNRTSDYDREIQERNATYDIDDPVKEAAVLAKMRQGWAGEDALYAQGRMKAYQMAAKARAGITDTQTARELADQQTRAQLGLKGIGNEGFARRDNMQSADSRYNTDTESYLRQIGLGNEAYRDTASALIDAYKARTGAEANDFELITNRMKAEGLLDAQQLDDLEQAYDLHTKAHEEAGDSYARSLFGGGDLRTRFANAPEIEGDLLSRRERARKEAQMKLGNDAMELVKENLGASEAAMLDNNPQLEQSVKAYIRQLAAENGDILPDEGTWVPEISSYIRAAMGAEFFDERGNPIQAPSMVYQGPDTDRNVLQRILGAYGSSALGDPDYFPGFRQNIGYDADGNVIRTDMSEADMRKYLPHLDDL